MIPAGKYLLEVSLAIGFIFLIYSLLLKHSTLFTLNRVYLILGLLISFALPLIDLPASVSQPAAAISISELNPVNTQYQPFVFEVDAEKSSLDGWTVLVGLYFLVGVFLCFRFVSGILKIFFLKHRSNKSKIGGVTIYTSSGIPTFTFFNSIFSSPENLNPLIIRHELVHVREWHWFDLVIAEVASIVLWFNPVMIFYKRAVKAQHEFLADQGAVSRSSHSIEKYLQCMVGAAYHSNAISATSEFGARSIKTRIIMMTKNKTSIRYAGMYLLIVPAAAFLLFAFQDAKVAVSKPVEPTYTLFAQSVPADAPVDIKKVRRVFQFGEKFNVVTNKPQHHSGIDFVTNEGENVMATADGIVVDTRFDEIKGNYVVIKHSDEIVTQYFHMKRTTVTKGRAVKKGEVIGFVGTTGLSVSNHLHYEVLKNGKAVDPKDYLPKNIDGC